MKDIVMMLTIKVTSFWAEGRGEAVIKGSIASATAGRKLYAFMIGFD